jgi:hypothetical protein
VKRVTQRGQDEGERGYRGGWQGEGEGERSSTGRVVRAKELDGGFEGGKRIEKLKN